MTYAVAISRAASDDAGLNRLELSFGELQFVTDVTNYEIDIPFDTDHLTVEFEASHPSAEAVATFVTPDGDSSNAWNRAKTRFSYPFCRRVDPSW